MTIFKNEIILEKNIRWKNSKNADISADIRRQIQPKIEIDTKAHGYVLTPDISGFRTQIPEFVSVTTLLKVAVI